MQRALMLVSVAMAASAQTMVSCKGVQYMVSSIACDMQAEYKESLTDAKLNECVAEFCPSLNSWALVKATTQMLDKGVQPDDCRVQTASPSAGEYFCGKPGSGSGSGSGGITGGGVFLIIFFVGGFLYFAVGMAYSYKVKEARGIEMVPNLPFWRDLPGLIKDGMVFVKNKVTGQGSGSYTSV